jgi:PDZ domain-containing secreted protein
VILISVLALILRPHEAASQDISRQQLIPILGLTQGANSEPIGAVAYLVISFGERQDRDGLMIHFRSSPGRFSPRAQTAVEQGIRRAARVIGVSTDSWTVELSVPHPGLTVYGESLSAMVGLTVIAMSQGEYIAPDHVITGSVTPDGHIGVVGGVPLKIAAAGGAHMRRILIPEEQDVSDRDWETPFLVQVSPVSSVAQAYSALLEPDTRPTRPLETLAQLKP